MTTLNHRKLFTSESVSEGHPDKLADQVSDAVLDAIMAEDPMGRVACETATTTGVIIVAGEITTRCHFNIPDIARGVARKIGYTRSDYGLDADSCAVMALVDRQSVDIARGVDEGDGKEQGAGDQGMMFGYACDETPELMPMPIALAHRLMLRQAAVRREAKAVPYLRPDAKSQVTVEYEGGKPVRINTVVISTQHDPLAGGMNPSANQLKREHNRIFKDVLEHIIQPVLPAEMVDKKLKVHINPTGRFVIGGPHGDTGLTGRKIIVDTYGGMGRHGGGAFSGKDPSKVDRSAAYAARWLAKNIVAAGLAKRCEIQLSYAIGVAEPVSISLDTFGTGKVDEHTIIKAIRDNISLAPGAIIRQLKLRRPIYQATAAYGHFGRENEGFPWEERNLVKVFKGVK